MKSKLFNNIQWQLTILYTCFLIIFLIAFILITYFSLISTITTEQKQQVITLADKEAKEHREDLLKDYFHGSDRKKVKDRDIDEDEDEHFYKSGNQTFYFIVSNDGSIIDNDDISLEMSVVILETLKNWKPRKADVKQIKLKFEDQRTIHLMIAGRSLYDDHQYLGTIYSGTNITNQSHIIQTLLLILIILSIIFIGLSAFIGYWMAGRAMVPILKAFNRQKEFTADASHELRTPLSIIQSSLEVIESEDRENLSSFSLTVLDDLKDEVKRMTGLVNNLLVLARSDIDGETITKEFFLLKPTIEKLQRKFQYEAQQNNIQITLAIDEHLKVYGDEGKITQLLYILVDNAIKYNQLNGSVHISALQDNHSVRIDVKDSGIGIPMEHRKRVFDRFYRVDSSRSRENGSSGIGLSIANWIAEMHNGRLEINSEEGNGSIFSLFLALPKFKERE